MDDKTIAPEEELKETEVDEPETEEPATPTVEDIIEPKRAEEQVPLKTFLEIKNEKKALERELKNLKSQAQDMTKSEIKSDLKSIADKYDVDPNFLTELSSVIYAQAKGDAEEAIKPVLEKEANERIDKALTENINKALEVMPEYEGVVNKDVLKSLAKLPENKNKTFQQLIEETYSKTVTGKKTMETSTPRGGKDVGIDWNKVKDPAYFKEIMADPDLKKQYNENLTSRINL